MTISRTKFSIVSAFLDGQTLTNYRNFSTDGETLWSYSTIIAYRDDDGGLVVRELKYSRTTTSQLSLLKSQLDRRGLSYKTSKPMYPYWYPQQIIWSTPV